MSVNDGYGEGEIRPAANDPAKLEAYLPTENVQNHAANLLPLANGDLLCVWFSGTQEGTSDISVYLSRLNAGSPAWSAQVKLSDDPARSEQNPVLFPAPDGKLWLFWTSQKAGNQDTAVVMRRISPDGGVSWGPIEPFLENPGTFVRQPIVVSGNGDWLLPVFYCVPVPGKKWVGDKDYSAVLISSDQGRTWKEAVVPGSLGCVHMNIVELDDGSLVAVFRSRWADHIYLSRSRDNGRTWDRPVPSGLPNNNSSIQLTKLHNGHLAVVFNNTSAQKGTARRASLYDEIEDEGDENSGAPAVAKPGDAASVDAPEAAGPGATAFWGTPRAPLSVAVSEDGGRTWPYIRDLEVGDGFCLTNNSKEAKNREYSYPSIRQTPDGRIHIAYTYYRQRIKYVRVDETWVRSE